MLPSPPAPLRPSPARAFPLRPPARPRAANPNTESMTTTTAATSADREATMGAAALWRRALGQRFDPAGVAAVAAVAASKPPLALPYVSVQDIRRLDWAELRRAGFYGSVFDKNNTLTTPYAPALWPPLAAAFDQCRATFPPGALAIYSNSAGLTEYDPDGVDAMAIEAAIEVVHVIRHGSSSARRWRRQGEPSIAAAGSAQSRAAGAMSAQRDQAADPPLCCHGIKGSH